MTRRLVLIIAAFVGLAVVCLLAIQLIPFGRTHTNPPVIAEPAWPDPAVRALAVRACFDCHSNETRWPWYADVAPASWVLDFDVIRGRRALNFSEWGINQRGLRDLSRIMQEGEMPPFTYVITHPGAQLSAAESAQLEAGLAGLR
jgi:hypothetical protein